MANFNFDIDGGTAATVQLDSDRLSREAPRWLFFAGDFPSTVSEVSPAGGVDFGSACIVPPAGKLGFMNRCLVTPMIVTWHAYNRREVPDGMRIRELMPGRDVLGKPTDTVHVPVLPGPEFAVLERSYSHWGLKEIECLRGKSPEEVVGLRINTCFFPEWPKLPEHNIDVITHIDERRNFFNKATNRDLYMKIADEMVASVMTTHQWMRGHVDEVHALFQLPANDKNRKSSYDKVDLHFIHRAQLQRRDQDQITMVETQAHIAKMLGTMQQQPQQPVMSAEDFLKTIQGMLQQNAELVKAALAGANPSHSPAPAPAKKEKEKE